jgi:hypothetical protein
MITGAVAACAGRVRMQAAEEFGAAHIGQCPVEQHDIRSQHDNMFERLSAVARFVNLRAVQGEQHALNDFAHPILVVDDQDLGLSERTFLSRGGNHRRNSDTVAAVMAIKPFPR